MSGGFRGAEVGTQEQHIPLEEPRGQGLASFLPRGQVPPGQTPILGHL